MLDITIPATRFFNEETEEFINTKEQNLRLEHSLVSLSKWESKYCRPFLTKEPKTAEETLDYIRCMTLTQNVDPDAYYAIPAEVISKITKYIESPQTATTFAEDILKSKNTGTSEIITSEIVYYWMFSAGIPKECEKWHINRLLTLIRVFSIKNNKDANKKMSQSEIMARNRMLNAQRRKALNSKG